MPEKTITLELTEADLEAMMSGYQQWAAQNEVITRTSVLKKAQRDEAKIKAQLQRKRGDEVMNLLCEHFPESADAA